MLLLNLSRWFNDWAILRKFDDTHQLIARRNVGVGAVHFGAYVATGLVIAGSVSGEGGGIVSMLVFFVLGQLSLLAFSLIYERLLALQHPQDAGRQQRRQRRPPSPGHLIALAIIDHERLGRRFRQLASRPDGLRSPPTSSPSSSCRSCG